jgi:hypothetical protein
MVLFPAIFDSFTSRKDKTWKISLSTNELSPGLISDLAQNIHSFMFVALKKDEFKTTEIETIDKLESGYEDTNKTSSQRLRNVFYILFNQDNEGFNEFNNYYQSKLEKVIEFYKSKII